MKLPVVDYLSAEKIDNQMNISSILKVKKITPLETTDNSLIGKIDKMYKCGECYYIQTNNKALKVFDQEGKYLFQIGSLGIGPEEFPVLTDFDVDSEYVYVLTTQKILVYDTSGNYKRSISIPLNASGFRVVGDKFLIFALGEKNVIYVVDTKGKIIEKKLKRNQSLRLARAVPFICYETHKILFQKGYSNDLLSYNVRTGDFEEMIFISSEKAVSSEKENELIETTGKKGQDLLSYGMMFDGMMSSSYQTIFGSMEKGQGLILWVKDFIKGTQKSYVLSKLRDDLTYTSPDFFACGNTYSPESFISFVQPYRIIEGLEMNTKYSAEENYKIMRNLLDSIEDVEESNPIIIEYEFE